MGLAHNADRSRFEIRCVRCFCWRGEARDVACLQVSLCRHTPSVSSGPHPPHSASPPWGQLPPLLQPGKEPGLSLHGQAGGELGPKGAFTAFATFSRLHFLNLTLSRGTAACVLTLANASRPHACIFSSGSPAAAACSRSIAAISVYSRLSLDVGEDACQFAVTMGRGSAQGSRAALRT